MRYISILLLAIAFTVCGSANAQEFEGSIYFTKSNTEEATQYAYHVKGNMVRIDEIIDDNDKLVATLLVNLETKEMIALSHERNLYLKRPRTGELAPVQGLEVKKGDLEKKLLGKNCEQYRVKSKELNSEVSYWVTEGYFSFFPKLLKILKRKDNYSAFYLSLRDLDRKFPMVANEMTLLRDKKGFIQVDKMEAKKLDDKMFVIPAGFEKVEK
jgi:hypothetical protein